MNNLERKLKELGFKEKTVSQIHSEWSIDSDLVWANVDKLHRKWDIHVNSFITLASNMSLSSVADFFQKDICTLTNLSYFFAKLQDVQNPWEECEICL